MIDYMPAKPAFSFRSNKFLDLDYVYAIPLDGKLPFQDMAASKTADS